MAHYHMSEVLSTLYNVGATLEQRYTFNANDLPTVLTILQRWANVIMLYGKSNDNIHKKEAGSYYVVSANKASSVTL